MMIETGASAEPGSGQAEAPSACAPAADGTGAPPPAPGVPRAAISTLLKRPDFLAAARARRWNTPGVVVQARLRGAGEPAATPVRVGYTCSKKVGNAVARNRAKRRLRAAAAEALPAAALPGWDYVLIGRAEATAARPMPELVADIAGALAKLHAGKGQTGGPPRRKGKR